MQFDIEFIAIEKERRRVAKELHDEVLPSLARLTRLVQSHGTDSTTRKLVTALHNIIASFRDLLGELHPVDLEELGLVAAIDNICSRYARITGLCVLFVEQVEEFSLLSDLQQLCLYRAIQAALKMFCDSENDILIVTCDCVSSNCVITVRCVDKRVSSADWLSVDKKEFFAFESWCVMAGAKVEIQASRKGEFPCDLIITIPQLRQANTANKEQTTVIEQFAQLRKDIEHRHAWVAREGSLFETLAVESERKKINEDISKLIMPQFNKLLQLAGRCKIETLSQEMNKRLYAIAGGVKAIMEELHPPLLAKAGLTPSIKALVDRFRLDSQIETTLVSSVLSAQLPVSLEAKFVIYRVTQEALNNIEKHSAATIARVIIKQVAQRLVICIEDNGKGFQERRSSQSRGLKNIRERAASVGAEVIWDKSISFSTGTLVSISLNTVAAPQSEKPLSEEVLRHLPAGNGSK